MTTTSPDVRFHLDVWAVCYRPVQVGWKRSLAACITWGLAVLGLSPLITHLITMRFLAFSVVSVDLWIEDKFQESLQLSWRSGPEKTVLRADENGAFRLMLHHRARVRTLADTVIDVIGCTGFRHQGAQSFSSPGVKLEFVAGENLRGKAKTGKQTLVHKRATIAPTAPSHFLDMRTWTKGLCWRSDEWEKMCQKLDDRSGCLPEGTRKISSADHHLKVSICFNYF